MAEYDTQPTIETVYDALQAGFKDVRARLDQIEARLSSLESETYGLRAQMDDLHKNNRRLESKVNVFVEEVIALSRLLNRT
jgi:septation ring formation regulator EzrA